MKARINALAIMSYQSKFRREHGTLMPIPPFNRLPRREQAAYLRRAHSTAWAMNKFTKTNMFTAYAIGAA